MSSISRIVLVTAATGTQGSHAIQELLLAFKQISNPNESLTIRAFVRDPSSETAQALLALDPDRVQLFQGDFDDVESLSRAAQNCTSVFINVTPSFTDAEAEVRHARNIISASLTARIKHVILSSTNAAEQIDSFKNFDPNNWVGRYFINKTTIINMVKRPPFPTPEGYRYTILQPAGFLTNFLPSPRGFAYPTLTSTDPTIETAHKADLSLSYLDPADIGRFFAQIVLTDDDIFTNRTIRLASANLTMTEIAAALTKAVQNRKVVKVKHLSAEEAEAIAESNPFVASQIFQNDNPKTVDLDEVGSYGIELGSVEGFFEREKVRLEQAVGL